MKLPRLALLACVLIFGGCSDQSAPVVASAPTSSSPHRDKWEYNTVVVSVNARDAALAKNGAQGWELISSEKTTGGSKEEVSELQYQIDSIAVETAKHFIVASENALEEDSKKVIASLANLITSAGDNTSRLKEALELTERFAGDVKKEKHTASQEINHAITFTEMSRAIEATRKKMSLINEYNQKRAEVYKLIFKRKIAD